MKQADSLLFYRRSYQRFILEASASLIIHKNIEEPSILRDLCPRGIGIITYYPLKENQEVTIIIKVPYLFGNPVNREAKVAWCKRLDENLWQGGLDFGEDNKINLLRPSSNTP